MRLVFDIRVLQLKACVGGIRTYILELLREYARSRREVTLLAWEGQELNLTADLQNVFPMVTVKRIKRIPRVGNVCWLKDSYLSNSFFRGLAKHGDLVHFPMHLSYELGWPVADIGIPRIQTIYDMALVRSNALVFPPFSDARYELTVAMYRFLASRCQYLDGIISISTYTTGAIIEYLRRVPEIATVLLGVEERFQVFSDSEKQAFRQRLGLPQNYVLYVGTLSHHKNVRALLEGLDGRCPWPIVLVGPQLAHERIALENEFTHLDLRWLGYVDSADLPGVYACAGVFVFPSLSEGFGLPVLEAMACGTPVACSNVSSLPEVAGQAALFFSPYDSRSLARTVMQIIDDEHLRRKLSELGRARAAGFRWSTTAQATWQAYEHFVAQYRH